MTAATAHPTSFGERLAAALPERSPLCVGIDPSASLLERWGLPDSAEGLAAFGAAVVDAVEGVVAIVKPQSAFFERHGSAGVAALEQLCRLAASRGLLVLLDVKRGDVGTTSQAYADAYLRVDSPFQVDAVTAVGYLGVAALEPMFAAARSSGRGVFVVARSSNPEGTALQDAHVGGGAAGAGVAGGDVVSLVLSEVAAANAHAGTAGLGSLGVVFGATCDTDAYDLKAMGGPILAPGLGAQGATVEDIARRFAGYQGRVLPSASRSILQAGPDVETMRAAASELATACRRALQGS